MKVTKPGLLAVTLVSALTFSALAMSDSKEKKNRKKKRLEKMEASDHYRDGKFFNDAPMDTFGFKKVMRILKKHFTGKFPDKIANVEFPLSNTPWDNDLDSDLWFSWLGHSTVFLQIEGHKVLIDPVLSKRTSFVQWMGPKRMHPFPVNPDSIPDPDVIVISHNHYDHLDKKSIKRLHPRTVHFLVPLGVGKYLESWGVDPGKIHEMDWWEEFQLNGLRITLTPGQHGSGRGFGDKEETFWGGYAMKGKRKNVYYSGDTGFFKGFADIGNRLGPFDLSLIQIGAYNKDWPKVHMFPEEAVDAQKMVKAKVMVPLHWGTFPLAFHSWYDPAVRIRKAMAKENMPLVFPLLGEQVAYDKMDFEHVWWENLVPEKYKGTDIEQKTIK
ncbi:hypothetical protein FUAX_49820 (plasmid) [Fulvitalea axinellae]|uniref:Metallo-beta-lactamase domain-containing protein n=1 Tax=Fulvitalea axinellae TaxID=1182444 RepID=A0AAU9DMY2_9BACT|nr:hypothetical protein FUAX_49820 [Fulvitalea axinellae]